MNQMLLHVVESNNMRWSKCGMSITWISDVDKVWYSTTMEYILPGNIWKVFFKYKIIIVVLIFIIIKYMLLEVNI
jgi:hypothetical protein